LQNKSKNSLSNTLQKRGIVEKVNEHDEKRKEEYSKEKKRTQKILLISLFITIVLSSLLNFHSKNLFSIQTFLNCIINILIFISIYFVTNKLSLKRKNIKTTRK
jgi:hypothetical protein